MNSPLEYDKRVVKEFVIDDEIEQEMTLKVAHVREQISQIKAFLWRERVELLLSEIQAEGDVEALAANAKTKVAEHRQNIKGVVVSLRLLTQLLKEIEPLAKSLEE